jgi:hypothetical protein
VSCRARINRCSAYYAAPAAVLALPLLARGCAALLQGVLVVQQAVLVVQYYLQQQLISIEYRNIAVLGITERSTPHCAEQLMPLHTCNACLSVYVCHR